MFAGSLELKKTRDSYATVDLVPHHGAATAIILSNAVCWSLNHETSTAPHLVVYGLGSLPACTETGSSFMSIQLACHHFLLRPQPPSPSCKSLKIFGNLAVDFAACLVSSPCIMTSLALERRVRMID